MIRTSIGDDLFYPSDPNILRSLVAASLEASPPPAAPCRTIIIPHGDYHVTAPLLGSAWKAVTVTPVSLILLLLPVHSPVSPRDEGIFIPRPMTLSSPLGDVPVSPPPADAAGFREDRQYIWEEPALDTALPYIRFLFPDTPVLPVFCAGNTSGNARDLYRLAASLDSPDVLMAVSSNMSGHEPPETAKEHMHEAVRLLTGNGDGAGHNPPLEPWRKGIVSMCNPAAIEALRRGIMKDRCYRLLGQAYAPEHIGRITSYASFAG